MITWGFKMPTFVSLLHDSLTDILSFFKWITYLNETTNKASVDKYVYLNQVTDNRKRTLLTLWHRRASYTHSTISPVLISFSLSFRFHCLSFSSDFAGFSFLPVSPVLIPFQVVLASSWSLFWVVLYVYAVESPAWQLSSSRSSLLEFLLWLFVSVPSSFRLLHCDQSCPAWCQLHGGKWQVCRVKNGLIFTKRKYQHQLGRGRGNRTQKKMHERKKTRNYKKGKKSSNILLKYYYLSFRFFYNFGFFCPNWRYKTSNWALSNHPKLIKLKAWTGSTIKKH